jgi:hypothetical protein
VAFSLIRADLILRSKRTCLATNTFVINVGHLVKIVLSLNILNLVLVRSVDNRHHATASVPLFFSQKGRLEPC